MVVEKAQVSEVGWFVAGSYFDFDFALGNGMGGPVNGRLELALVLHGGGSGVGPGWVNRLWRDGWLVVLVWRLFREDCRRG